MNGSRQDAWTSEEDHILANTVLRYIREGGTQLDAFKEVALQLKRTPAACGFRWNANIRKIYEDKVEQAKRSRKSGGQANAAPLASSHPIDHAISLLESMRKRQAGIENVPAEDYKLLIEELELENAKLRQLVKSHEHIWGEVLKLLERNQPNLHQTNKTHEQYS